MKENQIGRPGDIFRHGVVRRDFSSASVGFIAEVSKMDYQYALNANDLAMRRDRHSQNLLIPGIDYAELPSLEGLSPLEIIQQMQEGELLLDIGCGNGNFGADILKEINPKIGIYGFDAVVRRGQERLTGMYEGDVNTLSPETFTESLSEGFDVVVSAAVVHHLQDPWGGFFRMTTVTKPGGKVLTSTFPRLLIAGHISAEDEHGYHENNHDDTVEYFNKVNVYDISGRILSPGDIIDLLNNRNTGKFSLEYHVASNISDGTTKFGGQISAKKLSDQPLDLSSLFYCQFPPSKESSNKRLGYILATTPKEASLLTSKHFLNVQEVNTS